MPSVSLPRNSPGRSGTTWLNWSQLRLNLLEKQVAWRKRVSVELTNRLAKSRIAGFEGREGHRTPFASTVILQGLSGYTKHREPENRLRCCPLSGKPPREGLRWTGARTAGHEARPRQGVSRSKCSCSHRSSETRLVLAKKPSGKNSDQPYNKVIHRICAIGVIVSRFKKDSP